MIGRTEETEMSGGENELVLQSFAKNYFFCQGRKLVLARKLVSGTLKKTSFFELLKKTSFSGAGKN